MMVLHQVRLSLCVLEHSVRDGALLKGAWPVSVPLVMSLDFVLGFFPLPLRLVLPWQRAAKMMMMTSCQL